MRIIKIYDCCKQKIKVYRMIKTKNKLMVLYSLECLMIV